MQQYLDLLNRVLMKASTVVTAPALARGRCLGTRCALTLKKGFPC